MKYLTILKTAYVMFKHTIQHLLTQDINYGDVVHADISWTISRKNNNEKT